MNTSITPYMYRKRQVACSDTPRFYFCQCDAALPRQKIWSKSRDICNWVVQRVMLKPYEDVEFRLDLSYTRGHRVPLTPPFSNTAMGFNSSRRALLDGNILAVNGSESVQIDPFKWAIRTSQHVTTFPADPT